MKTLVYLPTFRNSVVVQTFAVVSRIGLIRLSQAGTCFCFPVVVTGKENPVNVQIISKSNVNTVNVKRFLNLT